MLALEYFSVTTLSSVGFGDICPTNSYERLLCILVFCTGALCWSDFIDNILGMNDAIASLNLSNDQSEELERFFKCIRFFNNGNRLSNTVEEPITQYL